MWGTRDGSDVHVTFDRFIPTHVGNTASHLLLISIWTVHPHACGEHERVTDKIDIAVGSSPRMWGTLSPGPDPGLNRRFIPTHVGNTNYVLGRTFAGTVHPHACGEHGRGAQSIVAHFGSSPRMWRTLDNGLDDFPAFRFIPTHVGNTLHTDQFVCHASVHPHACGEHILPIGVASQYRGSSPRMWGTLQTAIHRPTNQRFIPTHVGNTFHPRVPGHRLSVHPHACGEHPFLSFLFLYNTGSSPRMWGTRSYQ